MSTLLMRLAAPLQSWGLDDKFERRGTAREPTKSGVIGLLAAALGISRNDDTAIATLGRLRFGVRIDRPGQLLCDFHTARIEGKPNPYVTRRFYLSDAAFVAGLEGADEAYMRGLEQALRNPVYPLFLGRRSCPPEGRVSLGLYDMPLKEALHKNAVGAFTLVLDAERPGTLRRRDMPVSYSQAHRRHAFRYIDDIVSETDHNPFTELEG